MSVAEIEAAIARLGPDEQAELRAWLAQQAVAQDPLFTLLGSVQSPVSDVAERHDEYLGQAPAENAHKE